MKKISVIASVILAASLNGMAHANIVWTGLYAGVNAGVVFNDAQLKSQHIGFTNPSLTCDSCTNFSREVDGVQLGYLYQFSNLYAVGIEANVAFNMNRNVTFNCNNNINSSVYDRFNFTNSAQTSIRGRVGRVLTWHQYNLLPYFTLGASIANGKLTYQNEGGDYYANKYTKTGALVGAGFEWTFREHWSWRAEYFYANYENTVTMNIPIVYGLLDTNGNGRVHLTSNNIAFALNYWI